MSRSLRRGALAAALALSLAPLTACAAGNSAQTTEVRPDTAGAAVGVIQILNAVVLTPPQTQATGPASVSARVYNNGSQKQTIDSIQVGSAQAKLSDKDGGQTITVPAQGSVLIGGKGNAAATLPNLPAATKDGDFQPVVFDLSQTGAVSVTTPVQPATGYYASYGPSVTPSPSASASASASKSASAGASASKTPAAKKS